MASKNSWRHRRPFTWLKAPAASEDGSMALADHLRELRYRVIISVMAIVAFSIATGFFYDLLYQILLWPFLRAQEILALNFPQINTTPVISGVTAPFTLAVKTCVVAGLIVSSPIWLFQVWRFIAPALLSRERKYAAVFLGIGIPLFLAGVAAGYYILPQGIWVMISFTPSSIPVTNLLELNAFLSLTLQLMLIFGIGFLIPLVVVGMNFLGVVSAKTLAKTRPYVIFGIFVFGAVATPSTDPFSMLALSLPMGVLYVLAEVIAHIHDRRQRRAQKEQRNDSR
ncbi:MAG: twin-arginine translocase subunit TatC [Propionibacteriaceae bacterium]|jgi:sec-independent protein translocase protein TatC|nr:twin-arginine translocase subunit TatC [Propionibacteriaceae bacterium]